MATDNIKNLEKKLDAFGNKCGKGAKGRVKVDVLNELAEALRNSEYVRAEKYASQALSLARRIGYTRGKAVSHRILTWPCFVKGDYPAALRHCHNALKIFKKLGNRQDIASVYRYMGIVCTKQGSISSALAYFFKALDIFKEIDDKKGMAGIHHEIGNTYFTQCDYVQAMNYSLKALQIFEKIGDKRNMATVYTNIGNIYGERDENDKSLEYSLKALKIYTDLDEKAGIAVVCTNIGCTYMNQHKFDRALQYHMRAMRINEKIGRRLGVASCYGNIAGCYTEQGQYDQALKSCLQGLKISEEIGFKEGIASFYSNMGVLRTKLKQYDLALQCLQKGLHIAREIGARKIEANTYYNISELYENQHAFKQALEYHRKYADLEKNILNAEKSKQIIEMKTKYETEKKEQETEIQHLKNVKLRKEIKERKKAEKELKEHRDHLEELVQERTAQLRSLAHELSLVEEKQRRKTATYLHDNIGQALSLTIFKIRSLQESNLDKSVNSKLAEIKEIVAKTNQSTRSLTFEISPPILYELGLESAIEWLVDQFQTQYDVACSYENDGSSKPLEDEFRIFLFQAVRELLTNVSKHAGAHTVKVSTRRHGNAIHISVEDDGMGFNPDTLDLKIAQNKGFGLFSIKERLRHLGGKLEVRSEMGKGTSVALIAPLKRT